MILCRRSSCCPSRMCTREFKRVFLWKWNGEAQGKHVHPTEIPMREGNDMGCILAGVVTIVVLYSFVLAVEAFGTFGGFLVWAGAMGLVIWACSMLSGSGFSDDSPSSMHRDDDYGSGSGSYTPTDYGDSNTDAYVRGMQERYQAKRREEHRAESRARTEAYSAARREAKERRQASSNTGSRGYAVSRRNQSSSSSSSRSSSRSSTRSSSRSFGGGSSRGGGSGRKF